MPLVIRLLPNNDPKIILARFSPGPHTSHSLFPNTESLLDHHHFWKNTCVIHKSEETCKICSLNTGARVYLRKKTIAVYVRKWETGNKREREKKILEKILLLLHRMNFTILRLHKLIRALNNRLSIPLIPHSCKSVTNFGNQRIRLTLMVWRFDLLPLKDFTINVVLSWLSTHQLSQCHPSLKDWDALVEIWYFDVKVLDTPILWSSHIRINWDNVFPETVWLK